MTTPFLYHTVELLYSKYKEKFADLLIIVPNKRGALFLKQHIHTIIGKNTWVPHIKSIEEFISDFCGLQLVDSTDLLFEFYTSYCNVTEEPEPFEEFMKWATTLLNDFNEIDKSNVDAHQLFSYLTEAKAIELWNPADGKQSLSDFQKKYLTFWQSLYNYYAAFQKQLLSKGKAHQGLLLKHAHQYFETHYANATINYHQLVFVGFNAFNKAEEALLKKLIGKGMAKFIWDADHYYINDTNQEAGKFLRSYLKDNHFVASTLSESGQIEISDYLTTSTKTIKTIGATKNIAQVKLAGNLVKELLKTTTDLRSTAIILADESLLAPLLQSLPENVGKINVTMGYPLANTNLFNLINKLIQLHLTPQRYNRAHVFYYRDLISLLNHPLLAGFTNYQTTTFINHIHQHNKLWLSLNNIIEKLNLQPNDLVYQLLTANAINLNQFLQTCIICFDTLYEKLSSNNIFETEVITGFKHIFHRIIELNNANGYITDLKVLQSFIKQLATGQTISFTGEPLEGLQIMGVLETRILDFDTIIMLSANEDIIPSAKSSNTFIPFDIKSTFKITTNSDKDSIFAYHFYRLLQRTQHAYFIYSNEIADFGAAEKSRFITQIANELIKHNPTIQYTETTAYTPLKSEELSKEIVIKKDAFTTERLLQLATKGLSPTAINTYLHCKLKFYFNYILSIYETDEVAETLDSAMLGTAIHKVLEDFYTPLLGRTINVDDFNKQLSQLKTLCDNAFGEFYETSELQQGKNFLTYTIAYKQLEKFLKNELALIKQNNLVVYSLEKELQTTLQIGDVAVLLKGKIDRIDKLNEQLRIIDYKTGTVKKENVTLPELSLITSDIIYSKAFQLLLYAYLYRAKQPLATSISSGIISFKNLSDGMLTVGIKKDERPFNEVISEFEPILKSTLQELFVTDFVQTTDEERCKFCEFKAVCLRTN